MNSDIANSRRKPKKIGEVFGFLTICEEPFYKKIWKDDQQATQFAKCSCICGSEKVYKVNNLGTYTKSCGCKTKEMLVTCYRHGQYKTRLYKVWSGMRNRCSCKTNKMYHRYGGRGIIVCKDWVDFLTFKKWADANGYNDGLTIDRIDVNGNYCPENCEWVTREENSTRQTSKREEKILFLEKENQKLKEDIIVLEAMLDIEQENS